MVSYCKHGERGSPGHMAPFRARFVAVEWFINWLSQKAYYEVNLKVHRHTSKKIEASRIAWEAC